MSTNLEVTIDCDSVLTLIVPGLAKIRKLSQKCIRNSSSSSGKQAAYSVLFFLLYVDVS